MQPYPTWAAQALANQSIGPDDALAIMRGEVELLPLLEAAAAPRRHFFANTVTVHILDNVQNGACPEDCHYCGQSKVSEAPIQPYKLRGVEDIVADARVAKDAGAYRFCMVLSGRGPDEHDIAHMSEAIRQVKAMGMRTCLSAGLMDGPKVRELKEAGLDRLNHNLNTSERHYGEICTTHTYRDRLDTLKHARDAGIGLCSGVIAGMGESYADLVEVAFALREIRAESIPVNFLLPIAGNPLQADRCEGAPLNPQLCLRILCMMRLVNPDAEVRVAAGREHHLRGMQAMALWPANSLFVDGYLLTEGSKADETLRMILDAGFEVKVDDAQLAQRLRSLHSTGPTLKQTVRKRDFVPAETLTTRR